MPKFIYDIIPPGFKKGVVAATQEVSKWIKLLRLFLKTSKYGSVVLIIAIVGFGALLVWAFSPETETIEIFPTQYETEADSDISWQNGEKALQREFDKNATLAEFSSENSAVLFEEVSYDNLLPETLGTESENLEEPKQLEEESKTTEPSIEEPTIEEPVIEEPVIEEPEATPSENLEENLIIFRDLFKLAIGGDPEEETQLDIENPTGQAPEETTEKPVEEPPVIEDQIIEEIESSEQETEPAVLGEELEQPEEDVASDADDLLRLLEEIEETPSISQPPLIKHSIVFSDFNLEPLGSLEKVKLNFSFASKLIGEKDILLVEYKTPLDTKDLTREQWATLMIIKLDKELSNSINNGYWQEKISDINSWEDLNNLKIRLTVLTANPEDKSPVYLDAVWLEVEYEEISDIKEKEKRISEEKIIFEKSFDEFNVLKVEKENKKFELKFTLNNDFGEPSLNFIADDSIIDPQSPIGSKFNYIFWLDKDKKGLYSFNIGTQAYNSISNNPGENNCLTFLDPASEKWQACYDETLNDFVFEPISESSVILEVPAEIFSETIPPEAQPSEENQFKNLFNDLKNFFEDSLSL